MTREEKIDFMYKQIPEEVNEFWKEGFKQGLEVMHDAMENDIKQRNCDNCKHLKKPNGLLEYCLLDWKCMRNTKYKDRWESNAN